VIKYVVANSYVLKLCYVPLEMRIKTKLLKHKTKT